MSRYDNQSNLPPAPTDDAAQKDSSARKPANEREPLFRFDDWAAI